ncbi:MAG: hypothetical protein WCK65_12595 [Rhodospirillaceae bacterium]
MVSKNNPTGTPGSSCVKGDAALAPAPNPIVSVSTLPVSLTEQIDVAEPQTVVPDNVLVFKADHDGRFYWIADNGRPMVDYDGHSYEVFRVNPPSEDGSRVVYVLMDTPEGRLPQAVGVLPPSAPENLWAGYSVPAESDDAKDHDTGDEGTEDHGGDSAVTESKALEDDAPDDEGTEADDTGDDRSLEDRLRDMRGEIWEACAADAETVSEAMEAIKSLREDLAVGCSTTSLAGQALLAGVTMLSSLPDEQIRDYVETLSTVNAKGEVRMLKYNKRAEANLAIPLALDAYRDAVSPGYVSRISTVVGYAFAQGVEPDEFADFLEGEHAHRDNKKYGLKHAYQAAREYFSAGTDTAADKAARLRETVLEHRTTMPMLGKVNGSLTVTPSNQGLYCLLARTTTDGTVEIVVPVRNDEAKLIDHLLDILADQLGLKSKKASSAAKAKKPLTFAKLAEIAVGSTPA